MYIVNRALVAKRATTLNKIHNCHLNRNAFEIKNAAVATAVYLPVLVDTKNARDTGASEQKNTR